MLQSNRSFDGMTNGSVWGKLLEKQDSAVADTGAASNVDHFDIGQQPQQFTKIRIVDNCASREGDAAQ